MNGSDLKRIEYKLDLIAAELNVYRVEDVAAVVRRQHVNPDDGRITDVIDFYPPLEPVGHLRQDEAGARVPG